MFVGRVTVHQMVYCIPDGLLFTGRVTVYQMVHSNPSGKH